MELLTICAKVMNFTLFQQISKRDVKYSWIYFGILGQRTCIVLNFQMTQAVALVIMKHTNHQRCLVRFLGPNPVVAIYAKCRLPPLQHIILVAIIANIMDQSQTALLGAV